MAREVLERVVAAQFPEVGSLRRATENFLQSAEDDFREKLLLVVSELCTNAVEALGDPSAEFTLRVKDYPDRVEVEVEDAGPGFGKALNRPGSDEGNPRGRGLHVVQALVDDFKVTRRRGKTTVCCVLFRP